MCVAAQTLHRLSALMFTVHPCCDLSRFGWKAIMTNLKNGFLYHRTNGAPAVNRLLAALPKYEYNRLLPKL